MSPFDIFIGKGFVETIGPPHHMLVVMMRPLAPQDVADTNHRIRFGHFCTIKM